jgi:hypothetical protein
MKVMRTSARRGIGFAIGALLALASLAPAVAKEHRQRRHCHHPAYVAPAPAPLAAPGPRIAPGYDNVGSIVSDGHGGSYNRITGERYFKCMEDEGYGRVRPCDAGDIP